MWTKNYKEGFITNFLSTFTKDIYESSADKHKVKVTSPALTEINTDTCNSPSISGDKEVTTKATVLANFEGYRI